MRWEYEILRFNEAQGDVAICSRLNELGAEGWELVAVKSSPRAFYLKRHAPSEIKLAQEQPCSCPASNEYDPPCPRHGRRYRAGLGRERRPR